LCLVALAGGKISGGDAAILQKCRRPIATLIQLMSLAHYFDPDCRQCPRLATFLDTVKQQHPSYHARPVAPFGDPNARLLVVGLAPGMHGANASGRPFTGDYAGLLLYQVLFDMGFSNQAHSTALDDGLLLRDCRITNAVKCLPPQNKPLGEEIKRCNPFLARELATLPTDAVIVALGNIAHQAVLKAYGLPARYAAFGHHQQALLPDGKTLLSAYHCSRYNVQTKRLTLEMLRAVFASARQLLDHTP
jgi:uracil-DNA glycosylase family 4